MRAILACKLPLDKCAPSGSTFKNVQIFLTFFEVLLNLPLSILEIWVWLIFSFSARFSSVNEELIRAARSLRPKAWASSMLLYCDTIGRIMCKYSAH